jgi:AbrB family looped-hinge helix DNA binding protein
MVHGEKIGINSVANHVEGACQMVSIKAKIAEGGRIVIPAEYRKALGLHVGDEVILSLDDDQLRIYTIDAAIRRAQDLVSQYVAPERSLVDELITERRAEAEREY